MTESNPLVSVILPVNKDDGYLDQAVKSILDQSLKNIELIIIANNAEEPLWEKIKKYTDARIVPIRLKIGQLPHALNTGIENSKAPFIARMDADDIALKDRLLIQYEFLKNNPEVDVVGTEYEIIDERGTVKARCEKLPENHKDIVKNLPYETNLCHPSIMARKQSIITSRGYAGSFFAEDWNLWLKMSDNSMRFANINYPLLKYRIHQGQSTSKFYARRNLAVVTGMLFERLIITKDMRYIHSILRQFAIEAFRRIKNKI